MPCAAPPGSYCSPLDGAIYLCSENWYCPGGASPARACPDGMWSAVGSAYLDHCQENMNLALVVAIILLISAISVSICCVYLSYDWDPQARVYCQPARYSTFVYHPVYPPAEPFRPRVYAMPVPPCAPV